MTKKNEIATAAPTEIALPTDMDWGESEVSSSDITIPRVQVMQGLSKAVIDGEAKFGDYVDSMDGKVLGSIKEPLAFVPFHLEKLYYVSKLEGNDFKFSHIENITPANEKAPWEDEIDGTPIKRQRVMNFYMLDPRDTSLPYVISFKGMSLKAGKALATQMYVKNKAGGKFPPSTVMELHGTKESNDKGTFVVTSVKPAGSTPNDLIAECFTWFKMINQGKAKVASESTYADDNNSKF